MKQQKPLMCLQDAEKNSKTSVDLTIHKKGRIEAFNNDLKANRSK